MKEPPLPLELVDRGYELAHFFLMNEQDGLEAARKAAVRLNNALERQDKRGVAQAGKPTVTNLERDNLYLALVIDAAAEIAPRRDGESGHFSRADYLCLYLLQAIAESRHSSFPLAVTITRIVHSYTTDEAKQIYEEILFGGKRDRATYRDVKSDLVNALKLRFPFLQPYRGPHGEERFRGSVPTDLDLALACFTLELLTVWGPNHLIPKNFSASLMTLESQLSGPGDVHLLDQRRMHVVSDSICFRRLTDGVAGLPSSIRKLELPFSTFPDGTPPGLFDIHKRLQAPRPPQAVLAEIANIPAEQGRLEESWTGGDLRLFIDGEPRESLHAGCRYALRSPRAAFTSTIELWGSADGQNVLLGCETIRWIGSAEDSVSLDFLLRNGAVVRIRAVRRGRADAPVTAIAVVYAIACDLNADEILQIVDPGGAIVSSFPLDLQRSPKTIENPRTRGP